MEDGPRAPANSPVLARPTMPTVLALVFYVLHFNLHAAPCHAGRRRLFSRRRVTSARAGDDECSICLSAYEPGSYQAHMLCGHFFHCRCLTRWLQQSRTCPMCRSSAPLA